MIVVNLFGVPSAEKSTGAAYIFSILKMKGINVELVTESAQDQVWKDNEEMFKNQAYIFGKQSLKMSRCKNKVEVVITDSPLPLSVFYNNNKVLGEDFNRTVMNVFNSYNNLNYLLIQTKPYNPVSKLQTESEGDALKQPIISLLANRNISYSQKNGDIDGYNQIVDEIVNILWRIENE